MVATSEEPSKGRIAELCEDVNRDIQIPLEMRKAGVNSASRFFVYVTRAWKRFNSTITEQGVQGPWLSKKKEGDHNYYIYIYKGNGYTQGSQPGTCLIWVINRSFPSEARACCDPCFLVAQRVRNKLSLLHGKGLTRSRAQ